MADENSPVDSRLMQIGNGTKGKGEGNQETIKQTKTKVECIIEKLKQSNCQSGCFRLCSDC